MAKGQDVYTPIGGMDLDTDLNFIGQGDQRKNLNIRHVTDDQGSTVAIVPIRGNEFRFSVDAVPAQNKVVVISADDPAATYQAKFTDANGFVFALTAAVVGAALLKTDIEAKLTAAGHTHTVTITGTDITVEITSVNGYEWMVEDEGPGAFVVVTTQEPVDISAAGSLKPNGSFDSLGHLAIWWATKDEPGERINAVISLTADNGGGLIRVTTNVAHGLVDEQLVSISGSNLETSGRWIIDLINATTFDLRFSVFSSPASAGFIVDGVNSVGELGIMEYDEHLDTHNYTRLLRTSEWNLRISKQVDAYVEQTQIRTSYYWTDDFNPPMNLYYDGPILQDGAITFFNPNGNYTYGNIRTETQLFLRNTGVTLTFESQSQTAGAVKTGHWRYAVQFVTDTFNTTEFSDLTNPINVYFAEGDNITTSNEIFGAADTGTTTKQNVLRVAGISPDIFKFADLIGINYTNGSFTGERISRNTIPSGATEVIITHTGFEETTFLNVGEVLDPAVAYDTAQNIDVVDKRMTLSNLTEAKVADFSAWALTFKHSVIRKTITAFGIQGIGFGEYQDPLNVNKNVGYMLNETYRMGIKIRLKTGFVTQAFFVDDIIIDALATNTRGDDPTRRVAGLSDYDLTPAGTPFITDVFVPHIEFSGIDLDFLIDGLPVRDLIAEIIFLRSPVDEPTIITSGVFLASVSGTDGDFEPTTFPTRFIEFPKLGLVTYPGGFGTTSRKIGAFYSPDLHYGDFGIFSKGIFQPGDNMHIFGTCGKQISINVVSTPIDNEYHEWDGSNNNLLAPTFNVHPVVDNNIVGEGGAVPTGLTFQKQVSYTPTTPDNVYNNVGGLVVQVTTDVTDISGSSNPDFGIYLGQYVRPIATADLQYGAKSETVYETTGTSFLVDSTSPSIIGIGIIAVFGGDVFTQKSFLRNRRFLSGTGNLGGGTGIAFYSQNRHNTQMHVDLGAPENWPNTTLSAWLESIGTTPVYDIPAAYDLRNEIQDTAAFSELPTATDHPARIIYSPLKAQGSLFDNYRIFLPFNFHDLDLNFGPITHHANGNGELLTWQPRKFQRQYFNTRGTLELSDASEIVLGSGDVLNRDGDTLTLYGCAHKWGVIRGKSAKGHDVFYWINVEYRKAIRFGYDGTISLADIRGMQSFFANNLRFTVNQDTPAVGKGISGFWDDRNMEVGWTVNSQKDVLHQNRVLSVADSGGDAQYTFTAEHTFKVGDVLTGELLTKLGYNAEQTITSVVSDFIIVTDATFEGTSTGVLTKRYGSVRFWETGRSYFIGQEIFVPYAAFTDEGTIYLAKTNHTSAAGNEPNIGATWTTEWNRKPFEDPEYYNRYTVVINEFKNRFTAFYTVVAHLYLKWRETYFAGRPIGDNGRVYLFNEGDFLSWWDGQLLADGFLEPVISKAKNENNWWEAIKVNSEIAPDRFDFETKKHFTFLGGPEFETREDFSLSPIKEDTIVVTITSLTFVIFGTATVTVTSALAHGLSVGMFVLIKNVEGVAGVEGVFEVINVPSITTFLYVTPSASGTYIANSGNWSSNALDTGLLNGQFLLMRMYFKQGQFQKLVSIITKYRISPRFSDK